MPHTDAPPLPEELVNRLSALERRIRRLAVVRGIGTVGLALAVGMAAGLLVDFTCDVGVTARTVLLTTIALTVAAVACLAAWRCWRRYSLAELAAVAELAHPGLKERLVSTVELHEAGEPEAWKGSTLMRELLLQQTCDKVADLDFAQAVPSSTSRRWVSAGSVACLLLLLPFVFSPAAYTLLLNRFFAPWSNLDRAGNLYFEVQPGNRIVARGTDVQVRAKPCWRAAPGELPQTIRLNWTSSPGQNPADPLEAGPDDANTTVAGDSRRMELDSAGTDYVTTMPRVFHGFDYTISAGNARSRRYRVDVVDAPAITAIRLEVRPPAYTGRPAASIDGVTGQITVFEGSRLEFQMAFNKPVQDAALVWSGEPGMVSAGSVGAEPPVAPAGHQPRTGCALSADRKSATLQMTATTGGPFAVSLADEFGISNPPEPERVLVVVPDQPPRVSLSASAPSEELHPNDRYILSAIAEDDVAVAALELHYRVNGGDEQRVSIPSAKLGAPAVSWEFPLELSELKLAEGDSVMCRVRAADERPVPGPQEAWSETRTITIKQNSRPPGSQALHEKQQALVESLESVRKALEAAIKQVTELSTAADDAGRNNEPFTENGKLPRAAEQQKGIGQQLERLASEFDDHPLLADLATDARQLANQELRQAPAQVEEAIPERDLAKKRDLLEKSRDELAAADRRLAKIRRDLTQQAQLEQDLLELNRVAQQAEQLARQLAELDRQSTHQAAASDQPPQAESRPGERPKTQDEIRRQREALQTRQQALAAQLGELLKQHPELLDAAREQQLEHLKQLSQRANQLADSQALLSEELKESERSPPADAPNPESAEALQVSALGAQKEQEQIAADAERLAQEAVAQERAGAKATQEFSRQASQASAQAKAGRVRKAGDAAQQAAKSAQQAADSLKKDAADAADGENGEPTLAERARTLADRQQKLAENLSKAAIDPAKSSAARQQAQAALTKDTSALADEFQRAAKALSQEPLNLEQSAAQAETAGKSADEAERAMQQATEQLAKHDVASAAESVKQASGACKACAAAAAGGGKKSSSKPSSEVSSSQGKVPAAVASAVAEADRLLSESSQPDSESAAGSEGEGKGSQNGTDQATSKGNEVSSDPQPGGAAPVAGNAPGAGEPDLAAGADPGTGQTGSRESKSRMVRQLETAAQLLSQAARQSQPGGAAPQGASRPGASQPGTQSGSPAGNAPAETNQLPAPVAPDLAALQSKIMQSTGRRWGELPGHLQTEILNAAAKKPGGDYARLIKLYFKEIAQPRKPAPATRR